MEAKAWKSVHVMAGSIIEALLIDSLQSSDIQDSHRRNYLRRLWDRLYLSVRQKASLPNGQPIYPVSYNHIEISSTLSCSALRETVDQDSASIAKSLVEMIVKEVAAQKKKTYGYTAEQIVNKVEMDSSAIAIIVISWKTQNRLKSRDCCSKWFLIAIFALGQEYAMEEIMPKVFQHSTICLPVSEWLLVPLLMI